MNARVLPAGWREVALDQVAQRGTGHTPDKKTDSYWNGSIKWISLRDLDRLDRVFIDDTVSYISEEGLRHSSAVLHPAGTVVVSRDATVGKVGIMSNAMAVSQHFIAWRCGPDVHNEYLYYWLQKQRSYMERLSSGSTIKTVGLPFFKSLRIVLPQVSEQKWIASILRDHDRLLKLLADLIAAKARFRYGLIQRAFSAQLPGDGLGIKRRAILLSDILTESRDVASSGAHARKLTVKLYGRGVVAKAGARVGSENTQYYRRRGGQFIYSKLDFLNGAFGIVPSELDGYESTLDLPAFDVAPEINARWLLHLFSRTGFYKSHVRLANGGRKARRVNPKDLLRLTVLVPDRATQDAFAELLDAIAHEITVLGQLLNAVERQKRTLLHKLLSGEVRLPSE